MSLWKSAAHHASTLHASWSTNAAAVLVNGVVSSHEKLGEGRRSFSLEDEGSDPIFAAVSTTAATTPSSPYSTPPPTPRLLLKRSNLVDNTSSPPVSLLQKGQGESNLNSLEAWDYSVELEYLRGGGTDDLQLAAELGKTLLERNKELENVVKQHQSLVEDQSHEIEYLTKQNLALREVNESRLKVYEQLEVSINDLEDSNRKLVEESKSDKNRIKSLVLANNRLETRIEELQRCVDESSSRDRVATTSRSKRRERQRSSKLGTDSGSSSSSSTKSSNSDDKFWECNDSLILNKDECSSNDVEGDIGSKEVLSDEDEENSLTKDSSSETSSRIGSNSPASSGYSSEQPYRFSISSSDNFENKSSSPPNNHSKDESSSSTAGNSEGDPPFIMSQQKVSELQKAFAHLDSENALLKEEIEKTKQQQDDADTVQEEVLKINDVKIGKLCRRCLGNIENPLAQGLNAVQQIVQQVQSDFIQEKISTTQVLEEFNKTKEGGIKSGEGSVESLSDSPSPIPHYPAPHKYSPAIHKNSLSYISLQDELMMSSVSKGYVESGYTSLCGSRKDSSSSASSSITSFIRRKESYGSTLLQKDSVMSRKDSMQSTWSSPEYDLILSEVNGGDTTWSGPTSILLPEYTIPEEKSEELHHSHSRMVESSSEDNCSSGFFESIPYKESLPLATRSFSNPSQNESYLQNSLHQNYKDIFKEIFAILRQAQY